MTEHRVAIRMIGVATAARRFAYAITEGPERLIEWGGFRVWSQPRLISTIDGLIQRARPLFVVCEMARNERKSELGRMFNEALITACTKHRVMILCVERRQVQHYGRDVEATNYDLALMAAGSFEEIAHKLPRRRRLWDARDERMSVFLAAAAAAAGWNHFRGPTQDPN